jgi:membrane-associated phospholipid phosphatase
MKRGELTVPDSSLWWPKASLVVVPAGLAVLVYGLGPRLELFVIAGIYLTLARVGPRSRQFSWLSLPFLLAGVLYEHFGVVLPFRGDIHVVDLYQAEIRWFGIEAPGGTITLADHFATHTASWVDMLTGSAYALYMYELPALVIFFLFRDRETASRLAWSFLVANLLGMIVWIVYPAAPPWYVQTYGLGPAKVNVPASAAGAVRFDALLGIEYFGAFYGRSTNVFGAVPSLHVAYPMIAVFGVAHRGVYWIACSIAFLVLVSFSAVYLGHHYVLDVIAGLVCGTLAYAATSPSWRWSIRGFTLMTEGRLHGVRTGDQ